MTTEACEQDQLNAPSSAMVDFVHELVQANYRGLQKGRERRYPLLIEVAAQPVDGRFEATSEPVLALCCNISTGGMSLIHTRCIRTEWLRLTLDRGDLGTVYAKVVRCRQLKQYFEIACEFFARTN